jgi:UDPglucose 6-dehydrogenase
MIRKESSMHIGVIGTGYVGLVTGVCLSDTGQFVTCVDIDEDKVRRLRNGESPIFEKGLEPMLRSNLAAGRLSFTSDLAGAVRQSDMIFVAVGTPPLADGSVDMSQVMAVAEAVAACAEDPKILVMKSTVPVGTHRTVSELLASRAEVPIAYVSNPEFLKEGDAVDDFTNPDRVMIGSTDAEAARAVARLYAPFMRADEALIITDPASAEMAKYASNAMLAVRISFMNEIACLCDGYGANVDDVRRCVGADRRIGPSFLLPGLGYGGFCLPKDVPALVQLGGAIGCEMRLARATHEANLAQIEFFKSLVSRHFKDGLVGRRLAVWGVAYKAGTDDTRMSPALPVLRWLVAEGASVVVHDPEAAGKAKAQLDASVDWCDEMYSTLAGADALLVLTDWQEFRNPDWARVRARLNQPVVIDGRNLYSLVDLREAGFVYYSVGRPRIGSIAATLTTEIVPGPATRARTIEP